MNNSNIKAIAVLGMHRSGTSCITGLLANMGFYSGRDGHGIHTDIYNQKGYFEDKSIVECNEQLLNLKTTQVINESFDSPETQNTISDKRNWVLGAWSAFSYIGIAEEESLILSAADEFIGDWDGKNICVLKDPRLSLNFLSWCKYINFSATILIVRKPEDVVFSLFKRDNFTTQLSADLYYLYNYAALKNSLEYPRLIIDYDSLIDNSEYEISRICNFFENNNINFEKPASDINSLLDKSLNNNVNNTIEIDSELSDIYQNLLNGELPDLNSGYYSMENISKRIVNAEIDMNTITKLQQCDVNHQQLKEYKERLSRLNSHSIFGRLLSIARYLKSDKTFGSDID